MNTCLFIAVSFLASVIGAICGIGGGVIIKPVLDSFGILSISSISFLSGCTVLSMSTYSVVKNQMAKEEQTQSIKILFPLAIGAAVGGIIGKELFTKLSAIFDNPNKIGAIQAGSLAFITLGTLIYTIYKEQIQTRKTEKKMISLIIGGVLGILSSFLGIGGGSINLVVLYYFFSMSVKEASTSSLFIIFFSQLASLLKTIVEGTIPAIPFFLLIGMILAGIFGGFCGRKIYRKIKEKQVQILFILLMIIIIIINIYNVIKYL